MYGHEIKIENPKCVQINFILNQFTLLDLIYIYIILQIAMYLLLAYLYLRIYLLTYSLTAFSAFYLKPVFGDV